VRRGTDVVPVVHDDGVYEHLGHDGVLGVLLHGLEDELYDEQPGNVVLREGILALGVVGDELGDSPSVHGLHLHGSLHMVDTLWFAVEEANGESGILLGLETGLLVRRRTPTLLLHQRRWCTLAFHQILVDALTMNSGSRAAAVQVDTSLHDSALGVTRVYMLLIRG
jgi:hypothetical protein